MATKNCPACEEDVDSFVLCSECGAILDMEELELSPEADLTVIFKKIQIVYFN